MSLTINSVSAHGGRKKILQIGRKVTKHGTEEDRRHQGTISSCIPEGSLVNRLLWIETAAPARLPVSLHSHRHYRPRHPHP